MSITAAEHVYIAENEHVEIAPEFDHPQLKLLCGTYGPFRRYERIEVPLWLAVHLKKQRKCKLSWPDWLQTKELEGNIENEREEYGFTKLPLHYGEIGKLILDNFSDDHPESHKIRSLWNDLMSVRLDRVVVGTEFIRDLTYKHSEVLLKGVLLENVGTIDLLSTKRYITTGMDQFMSFYDSSQMATTTESGNVLGGDDEDDDGTGGSLRRGRRRLRRNTVTAANGDDDDDDD